MKNENNINETSINLERGKEMNKEIEILVETYTRSATKDDEKMERQQKLLREYCDSKGYKILKSNIDNGYSSSNLNRPAFQEMLEDMRLGKFKKLIIPKMDTLSRNICGFTNLFKEFSRYNCEIETVEDNINTATPNGKLLVSLLEAFAQLERETIKDRKLQEKKYKEQKRIENSKEVENNG